MVSSSRKTIGPIAHEITKFGSGNDFVRNRTGVLLVSQTNKLWLMRHDLKLV